MQRVIEHSRNIIIIQCIMYVKFSYSAQMLIIMADPTPLSNTSANQKIYLLENSLRLAGYTIDIARTRG